MALLMRDINGDRRPFDAYLYTGSRMFPKFWGGIGSTPVSSGLAKLTLHAHLLSVTGALLFGLMPSTSFSFMGSSG